MTSTPTSEFAYELRIPKDRVAVLIGPKGETKRKLERDTKTKIEIDSEDGLCRLSGTDALLLYLGREVIRAIARGFNPEVARELLRADFGFEIINIEEFARNQNDLERLRGRVIGEGGKSRRTIEDLTETHICVYGKTVGIIGPADNISDSRRAIQSLLAGSPHAHIYKWLERRRKEKRIRNI